MGAASAEELAAELEPASAWKLALEWEPASANELARPRETRAEGDGGGAARGDEKEKEEEVDGLCVLFRLGPPSVSCAKGPHDKACVHEPLRPPPDESFVPTTRVILLPSAEVAATTTTKGARNGTKNGAANGLAEEGEGTAIASEVLGEEARIRRQKSTNSASDGVRPSKASGLGAHPFRGARTSSPLRDCADRRFWSVRRRPAGWVGVGYGAAR